MALSTSFLTSLAGVLTFEGFSVVSSGFGALVGDSFSVASLAGTSPSENLTVFLDFHRFSGFLIDFTPCWLVGGHGNQSVMIPGFWSILQLKIISSSITGLTNATISTSIPLFTTSKVTEPMTLTEFPLTFLRGLNRYQSMTSPYVQTKSAAITLAEHPVSGKQSW